MKRSICRIAIKHFRALRDIELHPDRVNLLIGPTGSGKTSLRAAIEYALTRRNHWTNGAGTGIATQVSHGAKAGSVIVHLSESGPSGGPDLELRAEFPKEADANLKRASTFSSLGLSETVLRSALRGSTILDVPDSERREILCEALGIDVRIETLLRHLNEWRADLPDLGDWLDEQTARLQWAGRDYEKFAGEQRTAANRVLKETRQRVEFLRQRVLDEAGQENPPPAVSDTQWDSVRAERDAELEGVAVLIASEGPAQDAHQAALREYQQLRQAWETAHGDLAKAERHLQQAAAAIPPKPERYVPSDEVRLKLAKVDARLEELSNQRIDLLSKRNQYDGPCPPGTCYRAILQEHAEKLDALDAELQKCRDYRTRCQEAIRFAEQFDRELQSAQDAVALYEQDLQRVQERVDSLTPVPDAPPEAPPSHQPEIEQAKRELANLDHKLGSLQAMRTARETWEREYLEYGEASVQVEQLQDEATRWEALVKALEPRGLAARLSEQAVQLWADQVDASAYDHFGMRFRVVFGEREWLLEGQARWQDRDPDAGVYQWTPLSQMSGGERLLLSACIQVAIVRCTSLPIVFLDECQAADISRMKRLIGFLHSADVQAFLFAGSQNEVPGGGAFVKPKAIPIPGLTTWWVEAGTITPIRAEEAAA